MSKKINRNQIVFIGFSIVFAWVALMLIINNDFIRQNPILMNLPVFIGYVIISMVTVGKEAPWLIRWIVVFILAFCATWLTSIVVFLLFAFFYGLQWA